jgi:hypothetical protein
LDAGTHPPSSGRTSGLPGREAAPFDEGASRREPRSTLRASRPSPSAQKDEPAPKRPPGRPARVSTPHFCEGFGPSNGFAFARPSRHEPEARRRDSSIGRGPSPIDLGRQTRPPPGPRARRARVVSSPPGGVRSQPQGRPRLGRDSKRLIGCTRHPSFAEVEARYLARSGRLEETRGAECRAWVGSPTTAEQTRRREATSGVR